VQLEGMLERERNGGGGGQTGMSGDLQIQTKNPKVNKGKIK
jgi:hypothetical protein